MGLMGLMGLIARESKLCLMLIWVMVIWVMLMFNLNYVKNKIYTI